MMGRTDSQKLSSGLHLHFVLSVDRQTDRFLKGIGEALSVILYKGPDIQVILLYSVLHKWVFIFYFDLESARA